MSDYERGYAEAIEGAKKLFCPDINYSGRQVMLRLEEFKRPAPLDGGCDAETMRHKCEQAARRAYEEITRDEYISEGPRIFPVRMCAAIRAIPAAPASTEKAEGER